MLTPLEEKVEAQEQNHEAATPKAETREPRHDVGESESEPTGTASAGSKRSDISIRDILSRIDRVLEDTDYLREAVASLVQITAEADGTETNGLGLGLGNLVEAREATNQKVLDLLTRMYDDLNPKNEYAPIIETLVAAQKAGLEPDAIAILQKAIQQKYVVLGAAIVR